MIIYVTINEFEDKFMLAKKTRKTGKPKFWTVNGQALYNASLHPMSRAKVTEYYHNYLSRYINEQITPAQLLALHHSIEEIPTEKLSISLDIFEVKRGRMPDIGNLWLWIKWFEDALQECKVIPNDNPDYIIESGRKMYHWVTVPEERKLRFKIEIINNQ